MNHFPCFQRYLNFTITLITYVKPRRSDKLNFFKLQIFLQLLHCANMTDFYHWRSSCNQQHNISLSLSLSPFSQWIFVCFFSTFLPILRPFSSFLLKPRTFVCMKFHRKRSHRSFKEVSEKFRVRLIATEGELVGWDILLVSPAENRLVISMICRYNGWKWYSGGCKLRCYVTIFRLLQSNPLLYKSLLAMIVVPESKLEKIEHVTNANSKNWYLHDKKNARYTLFRENFIILFN